MIQFLLLLFYFFCTLPLSGMEQRVRVLDNLDARVTGLVARALSESDLLFQGKKENSSDSDLMEIEGGIFKPDLSLKDLQQEIKQRIKERTILLKTAENLTGNLALFNEIFEQLERRKAGKAFVELIPEMMELLSDGDTFEYSRRALPRYRDRSFEVQQKEKANQEVLLKAKSAQRKSIIWGLAWMSSFSFTFFSWKFNWFSPQATAGAGIASAAFGFNTVHNYLEKRKLLKDLKKNQ